MEWTSELWRRIRFLAQHEQASQEMDDEIQFHLAMKAEQYRQDGMPEREARSAARRQFGNTTAVQEASRQVWIWYWLEELGQDLSFALRLLRRDPLFAAVAVVTLALGIGANSVMFSFVDGVCMRPLPVRDPGSLVRLFSTDVNGRQDRVSYPDLRDFSAQAKESIELTGAERRISLFRFADRTEELMTQVVSGNYFTLLGVNAQYGRVFTQADAAAAGAPVVVMSHNLWQRGFHGDPSIVGCTLRLSGNAFTLVGVTPKGFRGTDLMIGADVWMPVSSWDAFSPGEHENRGERGLDVFGRLRPGTELRQARAAIELVERRLEKDYPATDAKHGAALAMNSDPQTRRFGYLPQILLALVSLVLMIACANVANLLLARSEARGHEIGVRLSLGCSRPRLVRQFLVESAVLASLGAAASLALTAWVIRYLPRMMQSLEPSFRTEFPLDGRLLAYTFAAAISTVFVFGLAPAWHSARTDLSLASRSGGKRPRGKWFSFPNGLVCAQVALSIFLLSVAGLLGRALVRMTQTDLGFERRNVLVVDLFSAYDGPKRTEVNGMLLEKLRRRPGVRHVSLASEAPFEGHGGSPERIVVPGYSLPPGVPNLEIRMTTVGTDYFALLGMRLLSGRAFDNRDATGAQPVAIINETMARRCFGGTNAVDRLFSVAAAGKAHDVRIVGVVNDSHSEQIDEKPEPHFFRPYEQVGGGNMTLMVETTGPPLQRLNMVRKTMHDVDSDVTDAKVTTLEDLVQSALGVQRLLAIVVGILALLGLTLAAVGLYGVVSYSGARRTREMGVRMALGAQSSAVIGIILRKGLLLASVGCAVGLALSLAATRVLQGDPLLYGVSPHDPMTMATVIAVMAAVCLAGSYVPARRACRVAPTVALREE